MMTCHGESKVMLATSHQMYGRSSEPVVSLNARKFSIIDRFDQSRNAPIADAPSPTRRERSHKSTGTATTTGTHPPAYVKWNVRNVPAAQNAARLQPAKRVAAPRRRLRMS